MLKKLLPTTRQQLFKIDLHNKQFSLYLVPFFRATVFRFYGLKAGPKSRRFLLPMKFSGKIT
jgi:hypothetical protein